MEELARQIAILNADMAWVKSILSLLLNAVVGLALVNLATAGFALWQIRNNHKRKR